MRTLLDAPGLDGMTDAARLAVVVLASRTPYESGVVEIRTPELARWLGLSASYVASDVVSALRRSGVVSVETAEGESGQDIGLKCRVLPMWAAHGVVGHPLALAKQELATLLRLLEVLMAPGWAHRDGRVTPAGLLGSRTGRAAATDRLALLLLVLEARENGRVRQCGGKVDTRRGRAAATVARLLGCTASAGERVLERLEDRDVVVRVRVRTASGLRHRSRLVVPAVAAAHGRDGIADAPEDRLEAARPEFSDPDLAAEGSGASEPEADPQAGEVPGVGEADWADPALTAALHTDHPPVAGPVLSPALSDGCSGEGRGGEGRRPEGACVREDRAPGSEEAPAASGSPVAKVGPLRGEKPEESPVDERDERRAAAAGAAGGPTAVGWNKAQRQRRASLPADLDLRVALGPVSGLWGRLSGWQQDRVEAAARAEVERLAGMLERLGDGPRLLADRLTDRLEETGGEALVTGPYGWLIRRGLVQRQACSDHRCDDGIRLDTGGECENCHNALHIWRARRALAAAEVDRELPGLGFGERRRALEERLRELTARDEEQARVRQVREVAEVSARRAAVERRREREAEAELARRSAPCSGCGLPDAAGLCPACSYVRRTDLLVQEAVDLAVVVRADLEDAEQVAQLAGRCEADTRTLIAEVSRRRGGDEVWAAYVAQEVAEQVRDGRRAAALRHLAGSGEAVAEADAVYEAALRQHPRAFHAAEAAADDACRRTAGYLLRSRLGQLQVARARAAAGRARRAAA